MAPLDKIIASHSSAEGPNQFLTYALALASIIVNARFAVYGTPECLEEAICRARAHLISPHLKIPSMVSVFRS